MDTLPRVLLALLVGVLAFGVVGVGVTAALDPYIWPSAIVGLPVGIVAGLLAALATSRYLDRPTTANPA